LLAADLPLSGGGIPRLLLDTRKTSTAITLLSSGEYQDAYPRAAGLTPA